MDLDIVRYTFFTGPLDPDPLLTLILKRVIAIEVFDAVLIGVVIRVPDLILDLVTLIITILLRRWLMTHL